MDDLRHAEVTLVVHLPYDEHNDEEVQNIRLRAERIGDDPAFLASWYGLDADQLLEHEERYVEATVKFDA